jgi:hypothetical protein
VEEYCQLKAALGRKTGRKTAVDVKAALKRDITDRQVTAFLVESMQQRAPRLMRKGGRGGSGGVPGVAIIGPCWHRLALLMFLEDCLGGS